MPIIFKIVGAASANIPFFILLYLFEINKQGTTVLMATHNCEIVDSSKNRVIELNKGKIVRDEKEGKYHKK